ncbi:MAG: helix-turn-helix domain-containing protein [Deltaproteobacteria bacterium]
MTDPNTGALIRRLRQKFTMTQEEFAHALGITVSTVNRWENGHSAPSRLARSSIKWLAEARGYRLDPETLAEPVSTARVAAGFETRRFAPA